MKTVYFVRHAKSSWKDHSLADIDRPLNKRGQRDAPFMAKLLRGQNISVDQLVASPANRAFTTATHFAEAFGMEKSDILVLKDIYEAYPGKILQIIRAFTNDWNTVLMFGHNPAFTDVVNLFADRYIDNVPTCGIVRVDARIDDWSNFDEQNAKVAAFHYPKQYFD